VRLYFNGCSHTVGVCSGMYDIEQTYPSKLSRKFNAAFINSASPRSSNDRILRTTVEDICSLGYSPDVAIIQWSYYDRFETPLMLNEYAENVKGWKNNRLRELEWKQYGPWIQLYRGEENEIFHEFVDKNKTNAINSFLSKVILLDTFLLSHNIRPVHMFFPATKIMKNNPIIQSLLAQCDTDNFFNSPFLGVESCLDENEFARGEDNHFLEEAHTFLADSLENFILNNIPLQFNKQNNINREERMYVYPG